jgi:hypothetical protein
MRIHYLLVGVEETVCKLLDDYKQFHELKGRNLYGDR